MGQIAICFWVWLANLHLSPSVILPETIAFQTTEIQEFSSGIQFSISIDDSMGERFFITYYSSVTQK